MCNDSKSFLFAGWELQCVVSSWSVFLTSPSSKRCHHMTWHAFLVAPDEPFLTIQHGQLDLLPLPLPWTEYSTDVRSVFLDSCLLTFVCTMSINENMHILDDVT